MVVGVSVIFDFFLASSVMGYDCSVSCPVDKTVENLDVVDDCVNKDTETNPTWCDEIYRDDTGTCTGCGPINWYVGDCGDPIGVTSTDYPYDVEYHCDEVSAYKSVACCGLPTAKSCGGSCGVAACETGLSCSGRWHSCTSTTFVPFVSRKPGRPPGEIWNCIVLR